MNAQQAPVVIMSFTTECDSYMWVNLKENVNINNPLTPDALRQQKSGMLFCTSQRVRSLLFRDIAHCGLVFCY
jgi:hypothetical protein